MDLDAEMRKLQEEARRELASREDAEAAELPPTPIPAELRAPASREGASKLETSEPSGREVFDPGVLREAADLAEKAQGLKAMSWKAKLGWGAAALVGFLIAWELFLGKLVLALISVAVLVLLVVAILRVSGAIGPAADDEDEDEDVPSNGKA